MEICGCYAPVPTAMDRDGAPDPEGLGRHLEWLAREGLDGALILGSNGEFPSFDLGERMLVARQAAAAGEGLRLLLGIGACCLREVLELAAVGAGTGYRGLLLAPPFYFRNAPADGIVEFLLRVLDGVELPVLLYHIPQLTGVPLTDDLLRRVQDHRQFAGVKDSTGDPSEMERLIGSLGGRSYLVGNDRLLGRSLAAGGAGLIGAAASVAPRLVTAVRREPALQPRLDAVRGLLDEFGLGPAVKALLARRGFSEYGGRPPLPILDAASREELFRRWDELEEG